MPRLSLVLACFALATAGCFSVTSAVDPLPGPSQTAGVFAMPETEQRWVRVSVLLEGEADDVAAWFAPDLMTRWFAEEATSEGRVGGSFVLGWPSQGQELRGIVVKRDLPHELEAELEPFGHAGPTHLRLATVPEAPGWTRVIIDQWPFGAGMQGEAVAESHREAWFEALRVLRAAYERGLPTTPAGPPPPPKPVEETTTPTGRIEETTAG